MLVKILVGVAVVIVLLVGVVALQPGEFTVKRTATIDAPVETVFTEVNNLHGWEEWSPWAKLDPEMKQSYDGPTEGKGASYAWSGNDNVGEGQNTIVESRPNERIDMKLEFKRPFAGTNDVAFLFKPEGDKTEVTWTMTGKKTFMCKAMHLMMDVDKMCGGQFEEGLGNLNKVVQAKTESVAAK